ncbi:hypothetical protein O181_045303 [Austropuccinia psidii MF-1]|uniref:Integrase catalytic domain-containing protein n=1 Tax=Austropuccinia psidii MF-1 TaxID=1389203 RepID=A0A9Q3DRU2_9BASI|nr:hypothetical protein [Austropuccinia psidii MF-1]
MDVKDISTIPILDGTNYGHWQMRMKIHLRSRDLLEVCNKPCPSDASTGTASKWTKASFEAINIITTRITERVFREVINSETIENSHLLWSKISEQYASKRAVNRGRVWMDWQLCFFDGNLQNYIDHCRKLMMELDAVSIVVPNELLSYSLLGKLGGNPHLSQFVETLIFNEDIIEKPLAILSRLQDFASHSNLSNYTKGTSSSALVTTHDEPHKVVFYCSQGKHNLRCTTHKKEECWAENPHLRPSRREKKRKNNPSAHLSIAQALTTIGGNLSLSRNQVVIDCGATHHMFNSPSFFCSPPTDIKSKVATGDAQSHLLALGLGNVILKNGDRTLHLKNCLYVPKLKCNLISLLELFNNQLTIQKTKFSFSLISKGEVLLEGKIVDRLMYLTYDSPTSLLTTLSKDPWHCRLGHPGHTVLKTLGLPDQKSPCFTCDTNKSHRLPFSHHFEPVSHPLDAIHLDLVGPISPQSNSGFRFFLTIVDQASSYKIVKFLRKKSDSFDQFLVAKNYMENWHSKKIKKIISNRGGEFLNQKFSNLAVKNGIIHTYSPPETPEHNGYSERANRTILEKARCLINSSNLPTNYWAEAVNTATFISNLLPTPSRDNISPHVLWKNTPAKVTNLRTFGCQTIIHRLKRQRDWKLSPPGEEGILLGYENGNTTYRILRLSDLNVVITRNASFNEKVFPSVPGGVKFDWNFEEEHLDNQHSNANCSLDTNTLVDSSPFSDMTNSQETEEQNLNAFNAPPIPSPIESNHDDLSPSRTAHCPNNGIEPSSNQQSLNNYRPTRLKVIDPRHPTLITSNIDSTHILPYPRRAKTFLTDSNYTPRTYRLALQCESKDEWTAAISKELSSMNDLNVWDIVELQDDYKLVGTTWVFKIKKNHLQQPIEHKARLCAQGFTQTQGIDFEKTYAPTGRLNSLRALIAHACTNNLEFHQIDVKSAFLNAPLLETVYLSVPQGLAIDCQKYCLRLKKAI